MKPRLPHKQHGIPVSASGTNGPGKDIQAGRPAATNRVGDLRQDPGKGISHQVRGTCGGTNGLRELEPVGRFGDFLRLTPCQKWL